MNNLPISDFKVEDLKEISKLMLQLTGVQLHEKQSAMIQSRLLKRMVELGMQDSALYVKYLKENFSTESKILITLLTTHHTFFYRESFHFEYLIKDGLKRVIDEVRAQKQTKIRIWSAACSHGQEVYTLAMILEYHLPKMAPDLTYEILGTDVDIDCIKIAKNGVYRFEQLKEMPTIYLADHWQRGSGDISQFVRIKESIRQKCQFMTSNLFDMSTLMGQKFHILFCRNVFIYFNQLQINSVSKNLQQMLHNNGLLFLGLSETLTAGSLGLDQVGPSIYLKGIADKNRLAEPANQPALKLVASNVELQRRTLRVVCVDDSPVILSLLKKILNLETGFEIVATAANGEEAHQKILQYQPDIVTLDIHMPQMSGVDYLKKYMNELHPPVVMISSVSREETEFGLQSLELGAIDFIEKPTLANLQIKSDEIRSKLRCAVDFHEQSRKQTSLGIVRSFKLDMNAALPSGYVRVCVAGIGDLQKIKYMTSQFGKEFPPFVILLHGAETFVPLLLEQLKSLKYNSCALEENTVLQANHIYLATFEKLPVLSNMMAVTTPSHVFVMGDVPLPVAEGIQKLQQTAIFLEEIAVLAGKPVPHNLKQVAQEILPYTSMIYHSNSLMISRAAA